MKVLFISQFAGSAYHGMVTRNYNWATELMKRGHEVTIIAASFSHYRNAHPDMGDFDIKREVIDGINYIWLKCPRYDGNSAIGRIIAMVAFSMRLGIIVYRTRVNYNLIIASSPQPFVIYPAHKIAKKNNAKLIYDIRDLWPLTLKELAKMKSWHPFIWLLQRAEDFACRHADLITAVPQNCEPYLQSRGLSENKFLAIGNGFLLKEGAKKQLIPELHKNLISDLREKSAFIIGYTGTLGRANAIHIAIKSIARSHENVHFVVVGQGNYQDELKKLTRQLNVESQVHFLPVIAHDQIHDFLSQVDVVYIGTLYSSLFKWGASPAKMNDYMMAAKPVIYAIGDPGNPVEKSGCGICCEAENLDQIGKAIIDLRKMPLVKRDKMGRQGRQWLLDNQLISHQIKLILHKLLPDSNIY